VTLAGVALPALYAALFTVAFKAVLSRLDQARWEAYRKKQCCPGPSSQKPMFCLPGKALGF